MQILRAIYLLFFPPHCIICNTPLFEGETHFCMHCYANLPRIDYKHQAQEEFTQIFQGKVLTSIGVSFLHYSKGSPFNQLVYQFKYKGNKELAIYLGALMGKELKSFYEDNPIDYIVPIPLHPKRAKERGYNQSEQLALGFSLTTKIPLLQKSLVERVIYTETQTHKSALSREAEMQQAFKALNLPEIEGKHLLLLDDVLTTGSTLMACEAAILQENKVTISYVTLFFTK